MVSSSSQQQRIRSHPRQLGGRFTDGRDRQKFDLQIASTGRLVRTLPVPCPQHPDGSAADNRGRNSGATGKSASALCSGRRASWIEPYLYAARRQTRLSSLDLEDRRTGAMRSPDEHPELLPSGRHRARPGGIRAGRDLRNGRRHPDRDRRDAGAAPDASAWNCCQCPALPIHPGLCDLWPAWRLPTRRESRRSSSISRI
jgi:hypothetical protein